jgi:hypothetical protein
MVSEIRVHHYMLHFFFGSIVRQSIIAVEHKEEAVHLMVDRKKNETITRRGQGYLSQFYPLSIVY